MKKIAFACLAVIGLLFTACSDPNSLPPEAPVSVQEAIDKAEDSVTLNADLTLEENETIKVSKAIKVSGGETAFDMKGATFTIDVSGATLSNLKNVKEVIVSENVGNGDFTLSSCNVEKITVLGGGANSIHLEGSTVIELSVQKESVRIVLEKGCEVETTKVLANCTLDSADETAKFQTVATDKKVTEVKLEGQVCVKIFVASSTETTIIIETEDVVIEKAGAVETDSQGKPTVAEVKIEAGKNLSEENLPKIEVIDETELKELSEGLEDLIVESSDPEDPKSQKDPEDSKAPEGTKDPEDTKDPEGAKDPETPKGPETPTDPETPADPTPDPNPEGNKYYIEVVEVEGKPGITVKLNEIPADSTGIQYYIYCVTEGVLEANNDAYVSPASKAYTEYYYPFVTPGNEYEVYIALNSQTQDKTATRTITPKTGLGSLKSSRPHDFKFDAETNVITFHTPVYSEEIPTNGDYWINCFGEEAIYMDTFPASEIGEDGLITFDLAKYGNKNITEFFAGKECSFDAEYLFTYNGFLYAIQYLDGWKLFTPTKNVYVDHTKSERLSLAETDDGRIEITVKLLKGEKTVDEWWGDLYETNTGIKNAIHCNAEYIGSEKKVGELLNEGEAVKFYYPFVKAGETYEFTINGQYQREGFSDYWGGETAKITATKTNPTYGSVNPQNWGKSTLVIEYIPEEGKYRITTPDYDKDDFEADFGAELKDICNFGIGCFAGKSDWKKPYVDLFYWGGYEELPCSKYFYDSEASIYGKIEFEVHVDNFDEKKKAELEATLSTNNTYCAYLDMQFKDYTWKLGPWWTAEVPYTSGE